MKNKWKFLDSDTLKIIAIVTMLIDHVAFAVIAPFFLFRTDVSLYWNRIYTVMRDIGRTAFPIFVFLLVEGFFHTHSRRKYMGRLVLFTALSEIPFDLAFYGRLYYGDAQNVFWTLSIGFAVIWGLESLYGKLRPRRGWAEKSGGKGGRDKGAPSGISLFYMGLLACLAVVVILAGIAAAVFLRTDYDAYGVLLIVLFYLGKRANILPALICMGGYLLFLWEPWSIFGFLLILCYNGARKKRGKGFQYFFYLFYPLHLSILGVIRVAFLAN